MSEIGVHVRRCTPIILYACTHSWHADFCKPFMRLSKWKWEWRIFLAVVIQVFFLMRQLGASMDGSVVRGMDWEERFAVRLLYARLLMFFEINYFFLTSDEQLSEWKEPGDLRHTVLGHWKPCREVAWFAYKGVFFTIIQKMSVKKRATSGLGTRPWSQRRFWIQTVDDRGERRK